MVHGATERGAVRTSIVAGIVLAAMMLTMVIAVIGARRFAADRIEGNVRAELVQSAALAAVAEAENVDRLTAAASALASDPALVSAMREGADRERLEPFARRLQQSTDGARGAFVVTPDARAVAMHPVDESVLGKRYPDRDWYRGVVKRSPYVSSVYSLAAFEQPKAVSVAVAVRDGEGVVGYVTVAVEASLFGRALARAAGLEDAPSLRVVDQAGATIAGEAASPGGDDRVLSSSREVRGTGWSVVASVTEREALRDLRSVRVAATSFLGLTFALLTVLGIALFAMGRRLESERRAEERRAQAFELNDTIVQRLAVSHLALSLNRREEAMRSLEQALDAGRRIISDLADGRDSFVRDAAAGSDQEDAP